MKKRLSILLTVIFAVSIMLGCVIFATGCISSESKDLTESNWKIDLNASSSTVRADYSEDMTIVIRNGHVEIIKGGDLTGLFSIERAKIENGVLSFSADILESSWLWFDIKGDTLSFYFGDYEEYEDEYGYKYSVFVDYDFVFYRSGTKPSGSTGGNESNGDTDSHFEDIKRAYRNDGYDVDTSSSSLDSDMQAAIKALQDAYAMMGYKLCYISKKTSAYSYELYMLIGTDTVEAAEEIEDAYQSICARSGKDVIISMGLTSNFEPFYDAT